MINNPTVAQLPTYFFLVFSASVTIITNSFNSRGQRIRRVPGDAGAQGHDPVGGDVVVRAQRRARARRRAARAHRRRGAAARAREQAEGMHYFFFSINFIKINK